MLYKSEKGKVALQNLYQDKLDSLSTNYCEIDVETSFGTTHIIQCGDESLPPILLIHGSNACAPIALEAYPNLEESFCVYAVDVLAQPNKSSEHRLSMRDLSYGKWLNEVIDLLGLEKVSLAGFSFGGLVILKTLEFDESKIEAAYLTAPAYIVNGNPIKAIFGVFLPMQKYRKQGEPKYLRRVMENLFSEKDDFAENFLSHVFLDFKMDFSPVPVISKESARNIFTPITIIACEKDLMFPGKKLLRRAKAVFPSLIETIMLADRNHVQRKSDNVYISDIIYKNHLEKEKVYS